MKNLSIPSHIGIILDGNGRWAKKRGLKRLDGHKMGVDAVKKTIKACQKFNIKVLSVYAFSTENWKRSKEEVFGIFKLLENAIDENKNNFIKNNIQVRVMGDFSKLPENVSGKIVDVIEETKNNTGLIFNIALNYGGQDEILRAVNLCHLNNQGKEITKQTFESYLYTNGLPPVDFVIRTSGEQRLSNFMLYQCAYAEFYFPKIYWPQFNEKFLLKALKVFSKRNRRFGNAK